MGYSANGYGYLETKRTQEVLEIVSNSDLELNMSNLGNDCLGIDFYLNDNYNEDDVYDFLRKITPYVLNCDNLEFTGEDDTHWRFVFKGGRFYEQNGHIEYEEPGNVI